MKNKFQTFFFVVATFAGCCNVYASADVAAKVGQTLTLPSAQELSERLKKTGFDHFMEKTKIHEKLGGQQKKALGVAVQIELSLYDYSQYMKNPMVSAVTAMRKPELLEIFLKDFPEELKALQAELAKAEQAK